MPKPATRRRRAAHLSALGLAAAALAPSVAAAADAQVRAIARDTTDRWTLGLRPVAISTDGREVLGEFGGSIVLRDIAAGRTTTLLATNSIGLAGGPTVLGASDDLRTILFQTRTSLSPADTDDAVDYYVLDRTTGATTLATGIPPVVSTGAAADVITFSAPQISGDGRIVSFRARLLRNDPTFQTPTIDESALWRFNRTTGAVTKLVDASSDTAYLTIVRSDTAGRVAVSPQVAAVDGRKVSLPTIVGSTGLAAVSADGSTIALAGRGVTLVNTTTGAQTNVALPSWLQSSYRLLGVGNNGIGFLVSTRLQRAGIGTRDALGWVTRAGAVTQIGGDVRASDDVTGLIATPNLAFAANGLFLAKIGSAALAGSDPTDPYPAAPSAGSHVFVRDTSCYVDYFGVTTLTRASVRLDAKSHGFGSRVPASAAVRAFSTASPATTYNAFTLAAGATRDLTVPRTGGWSYTVAVTFTDGSKDTFTGAVPSHPIVCDRAPNSL